MTDRQSVARTDVLDRVRILRDSLLDSDVVVDDERKVLLEHLASHTAALAVREDVARDLAAAIIEATR